MSNLSLINWNPKLERTKAKSKKQRGCNKQTEESKKVDIFFILIVNTYHLFVIYDYIDLLISIPNSKEKSIHNEHISILDYI